MEGISLKVSYIKNSTDQYIVDLLKYTSKDLNFSFELVAADSYGIWRDGNWGLGSIMDQIVQGVVDFSVTPLSIIASRSNDVDFSTAVDMAGKYMQKITISQNGNLSLLILQARSCICGNPSDQ